jgi:hypothetical protein
MKGVIELILNNKRTDRRRQNTFAFRVRSRQTNSAAFDTSHDPRYLGIGTEVSTRRHDDAALLRRER